MITSFNKNSDRYKDLFVKASEVLCGFERTQTYDKEKEYFYKDDINNSFSSVGKFDTLDKFSKELIERKKLYTKILDKDGNHKKAEGFSLDLGITSLEEYYNWLPELKRDSEGNPTIFTKLPLDDNHFVINLNTRGITIPDDFKKNGIAV